MSRDPVESAAQPAGLLNIAKPPGMASFAVVNAVRRITRIRSVGHGGTLDPAAEGVLPLAIGRATRVIEHLMDTPKEYRAVILLGVETDTYDSEGKVVATADPSSVSRDAVLSALSHFTGDLQQVPPMHSALKRDGVPLYRLARAGRTVERQPRPVRIYRIDLLHFQPPLVTIDVTCGRGTYIRSLAHDLGQALGCGAHLAHLTRTRVGPFRIEDAITPGELARAADWSALLHPPDAVLVHLPAALLAEPHTLDVLSGRDLDLAIPASHSHRAGDPCRAYSDTGDFLAILRFRANSTWHPAKVFA